MPPGPSTALEVLETEHTHTHEHNSLHTGKAEAKGNLSRLGADIWLYPITIRNSWNGFGLVLRPALISSQNDSDKLIHKNP